MIFVIYTKFTIFNLYTSMSLLLRQSVCTCTVTNSRILYSYYTLSYVLYVTQVGDNTFVSGNTLWGGVAQW